MCDSASKPCEQALVTVKAVQGVFNRNPVDAAADRRKEARVERSTSRKGGRGKSQDLGQSRQFDLGPITAEYELDPTWKSSDSYGNGLKRYIHKGTGMPRAVLTIRKSGIPKDVSQGEIRRQLETLCKIDHVNIVQFREACEDHQHLRLVYDWCPGGPLVTQLWRYENELTESHVAQIIRELLSALIAAHNFGVHHCDLGLFSMFLGFQDRLSPIKVFGFGLAGYLMPTLTMRKESRTNKHFYASPEMFSITFKHMSAPQRHLSDVWSIGAILFTLCSGRPPFGAGNKEVIMERVMGCHWSFGLEFNQYSHALTEFIEGVLRIPWQRRATALELMALAWMSSSQTLHIKDGKISSFCMQQLNSFIAQDHVKQTLARLLTDIGISDELYPKLEAQFRELDLNGDGTITLGEFMEVASNIPGMTREDVDVMVGKLDRNGNCTVDISEFIAALVLEQEEADEVLIQKAFGRMDCNGDARVTKKELFGILRQYSTSMDVQEVSDFIARTDKDGDKKMDYREFCNLFPQMSDKYRDIRKRREDSTAICQCSGQSLQEFRDACDRWLKKMVEMRDKIEIGCEVQPLPANSHLVTYSYEKGHFTEWEIQCWMEDAEELFRKVPGYQLTSYMKKASSQKKKLARMSQVQDLSMLGAKTLTRNQKILKEKQEAEESCDSWDSGDATPKIATKEKGSSSKQKQGSSSKLLASTSSLASSQEAKAGKLLASASDVGESKEGMEDKSSKADRLEGKDAGKDVDEGKDADKDIDAGIGEENRESKVTINAEEQESSTKGREAKKKEAHHHHGHHRKKEKKPGLVEWEEKQKEDRKERMDDPDYTVNYQIYENLYWLVKVKSDLYWQQPLRDIVADMRESCTEEIQHYTLEKKTDLLRLIGGMNEKYTLKDGIEIGEGENKVRIKKMARLLPLGVMRGKDLSDTTMMTKMEDIKLPSEFVMGIPKGDCTRQKMWFMHHRHKIGMEEAGRHLTQALNSVQQLFDEVAQDVAVMSSIEGVMLYPPHMSQLYLPFCEGREVADDAATPRSDDNDGQEQDDITFSRMASGKSASSFLGGMTTPKEGASSFLGGITTPKEGGNTTPNEEASQTAKKKIKIERNQVLTQAANLARKDQVRPDSAFPGSPEAKTDSAMSKSNPAMWGSSFFNMTASIGAMWK